MESVIATYYLQRKDYPALTSPTLSAKARAFRELYCGIFTTDPQLIINISGSWPAAYGGDGLYIQWSTGEIISIGREKIWVKWNERLIDGNHERRIRLDLCPTPDTGFTEIMFMTSR